MINIPERSGIRETYCVSDHMDVHFPRGKALNFTSPMVNKVIEYFSIRV